jgi:hypothetical protein
MSDSSTNIFLNKINEKWPDRNKNFDLVEINKLAFHPNLDGKKTTIKLLLSELLDYVKNDKKDLAISSIFYENKQCSGQNKNKFWIWETENIYADDLVHIHFNDVEIVPEFDIPLFKKPKKIKKKQTEFPGLKSLQYKRKNRHVKLMQTKLIESGFLINEKELGYYGKATCEAVKMYYRRNLGINSGTIVKDGKKFGPKAWERLFN